MTRRFLALLALLGFALAEGTASAEPCRPPEPGTLTDERVAALYDTAQERLAVARGFGGEARLSAARQAEAMCREVETRVACLPTNVVLLAESLALQKRYLEAVAQYRRLLDNRSALQKYRFWHKSIAAAEAGEPSARQQIGTVVLKLEKRGCATGAPVALFDGKTATLDQQVDVDPIEHNLKVTAPGCTLFERTVIVEPGESEIVPIGLEAPTRIVEDDEVKWLGLPPWVVIVGSAAILATAGVVTAVALSSPDEKPPATQYDCSGQNTICVNLK